LLADVATSSTAFSVNPFGSYVGTAMFMDNSSSRIKELPYEMKKPNDSFFTLPLM
jgi:hypothetical protein